MYTREWPGHYIVGPTLQWGLSHSLSSSIRIPHTRRCFKGSLIHAGGSNRAGARYRGRLGSPRLRDAALKQTPRGVAMCASAASAPRPYSPIDRAALPRCARALSVCERCARPLSPPFTGAALVSHSSDLSRFFSRGFSFSLSPSLSVRAISLPVACFSCTPSFYFLLRQGR